MIRGIYAVVKKMYSFTTYETARALGPPLGGTWQGTVGRQNSIRICTGQAASHSYS